MTDDELLLIYKGLRDMTEAMQAREIALDTKTAALGAPIAPLDKLPDTLGKQTSQYIAMGVRQSIQDDFSRPIAEAVKGPIADLSRETYHAHEIMAQVGKESRLQNWKGIAAMVLIGFILGAFGCYFSIQRDIGRIKGWLDTIQQQITPAAPIPDAKLEDGNVAKDRHRR